MEMMGSSTGRMSQTKPDLSVIPGRPDMIRTRFVPQDGQVLLHPDVHAEARESFANYFCKFDFTGQVPKEKDNNV
jgi:hypothetical protein